jgi:ABC-2 type transport system permease protein
VDSAAVFSSYLGLFLLGCVFAAVGILMSSFSDNQVTAFVLSFIVCLILFYGIGQFAQLPFMGDFGYTFNQLGLDYQYNALGKGLLDSRNIIYFITVIFITLWVTKLKISTLK